MRDQPEGRIIVSKKEQDELFREEKSENSSKISKSVSSP